MLRAIAQIHFDAGATEPLRAALEAWHKRLAELHQWAPDDKSVAAELELSALAIKELEGP